MLALLRLRHSASRLGVVLHRQLPWPPSPANFAAASQETDAPSAAAADRWSAEACSASAAADGSSRTLKTSSAEDATSEMSDADGGGIVDTPLGPSGATVLRDSVSLV